MSGTTTVSTLVNAGRRFLRIEGTQRAAAIAYYAFFSLFAAVILSVAVASMFFEREEASRQIIAFLESYLPIGDSGRDYVFRVVASVVNGRAPAGLLAFALLGWSVMRLINMLIRSVNRSWDIEQQPWWRLSLRSSLFLLVIIASVPLGIALPLLATTAREWLLPETGIAGWLYTLGGMAIRFTILFAALVLFYRLAPHRATRFSEVWLAAGIATLLLVGAQVLFGVYLANFARLNAVYGAFGAIVALLIWISLSSSIFIFGACLCAARAESK